MDDVQGTIESQIQIMSAQQSSSFLAVSKELSKAQADLKVMRDKLRTMEVEITESHAGRILNH